MIGEKQPKRKLKSIMQRASPSVRLEERKALTAQLKDRDLWPLEG